MSSMTSVAKYGRKGDFSGMQVAAPNLKSVSKKGSVTETVVLEDRHTVAPQLRALICQALHVPWLMRGRCMNYGAL